MKKGKKVSKVLMLDENNNIIAGYKNCRVASEETGIPYGTIYSQCAKNFKPRKGKYRFVFDSNTEQVQTKTENKKFKPMQLKPYIVEDDEVTSISDQPVKREKETMLVNLLVEVVNGTLEDGTVIHHSARDYIYSKKDQKFISSDNETNMFTLFCQRDVLVQPVKMELPLLDEDDMFYLKNIISRLKDVKGIRKVATPNGAISEFIRIEFDSTVYENIVLPEFKAGEYYSALTVNKLYTLEELNLR